MSNSKFWFDGKCSDAFRLRVGGEDNFGSPERIVTEYSVPGRNGSYIVDKGVYSNYLRRYRVALMRSPQLEQETSAIKRWLQADGEYHRLEDTYAPDVFRLARLLGGIETEAMGSSIRSVQFALTFSCLPEKYLKIGEQPLAISAETGHAEVLNPTGYPALPLISFYGTQDTDAETVRLISGGIERGCVSFDVDNRIGEELIFDAKTTEAYWAADGSSANDCVSFAGKLSLPEGMTCVALDVGLGGLLVYPRWWRI